MRNKYFLLLSLLAFLLIVGCNGDKKLNTQLNKMAEDLNQSAPAQLDEYTMFIGANVAPGNIFQYNYQVINTDNPDSLMSAMEVQTRKNIREAFQLNPGLKIFTDNNINIEYIYNDEHGVLIRKIEITPEDYN